MTFWVKMHHKSETSMSLFWGSQIKCEEICSDLFKANITALICLALLESVKTFSFFQRNNSWFPAYQEKAKKTELLPVSSIRKSAVELMRWGSARFPSNESSNAQPGNNTWESIYCHVHSTMDFTAFTFTVVEFSSACCHTSSCLGNFQINFPQITPGIDLGGCRRQSLGEQYDVCSNDWRSSITLTDKSTDNSLLIKTGGLSFTYRSKQLMLLLTWPMEQTISKTLLKNNVVQISNMRISSISH